MSGLISHVEQYLGAIVHGWKDTKSLARPRFTVAECRNGALPGVTAYITIGVSKIPLLSPAPGRLIRHELLILVYDEQANEVLASLLEQVSNEAIEAGNAYLCGEVIGPRGRFFDGCPFEAFYVAPPTVLPEEFAPVQESGRDEIVIAWLVPITGQEADFVRTCGWSRFEDRLEKSNIDLTNLDRKSIV